jgi:hydrogenase nickel incorporation protein HypA/HybF
VGVVSEVAGRFLAAVEGRRVDEVILEIGPGVDRGAAESAWAHIVTGTAVAGALVLWEPVFDSLVCFRCSVTYHGGKLDVCPACGGNGLVIEHAPEIRVRSWRGAD